MVKAWFCLHWAVNILLVHSACKLLQGNSSAELRPGESETSALVRHYGAKTGRARTTAPGRRDRKGPRGTTAKK